MNFTSSSSPFLNWIFLSACRKGLCMIMEHQRLNSGMQSGPEINRKGGGMSKNYDNKILKI